MDRPPPRWVMRLQWRLHRWVWNISGGRLGRRAVGMPILELETVGHRSRERRRILISYVETPTGPALAGTNAGAAMDPAWVKNLRATPAARIRISGEWRGVTARFLEGRQHDEVWQLFLGHSGYADYERMLERSIPLVVLEPG